MPIARMIDGKQYCKFCRQFKPQNEFKNTMPICDDCRVKETTAKKAIKARGKVVEKGCACACEKYPCFRGIENLSSNLALTCLGYKPKKQKRWNKELNA